MIRQHLSGLEVQQEGSAMPGMQTLISGTFFFFFFKAAVTVVSLADNPSGERIPLLRDNVLNSVQIVVSPESLQCTHRRGRVTHHTLSSRSEMEMGTQSSLPSSQIVKSPIGTVITSIQR